MNPIYKLLAGLLLAVAILGGTYYAGYHAKATSDEAKANKALADAILADGARVKAIDAGTIAINTTFQTDLTVYVKPAQANAEEQRHVIESTPSLAQCSLPADLVRLRADQAAASAALARESP